MASGALTTDRLVIDTGVAGVAVFGPRFEAAVSALQTAIDRLAVREHAIRLGAPPVIPRSVLERAGYVEAFPHLLGTVHAFHGDEAGWRAMTRRLHAGEDWTESHRVSDVVALPAACYHVYPLLEGTAAPDPLVFDLTGHCYRHERTTEPGRMRSFRMRELVHAGRPGAVLEWRDGWVDRARAWLEALGLEPSVQAASDPFFGSVDRLMGRVQRAEQLKWEVVVPIAAGQAQAVVSCNYHKDHFSEPFAFTAGGDQTHTACTAFGLERLVLAVLERHGPDPGAWPSELTSDEEGRRG